MLACLTNSGRRREDAIFLQHRFDGRHGSSCCDEAVTAKTRTSAPRCTAVVQLMEALNAGLVKARGRGSRWQAERIAGILSPSCISTTAGRPALHGSEPGQVRKEAATAILCKCRGSGSPPFPTSALYSACVFPIINKKCLSVSGCVCGCASASCLPPRRARRPMRSTGCPLELGSNDGVDMGRVGIQWDWNQRLLQVSDWHLGGYWDVALGQWHRSDVQPGENRDITEIGLTPVFRIQPNGLVGPLCRSGHRLSFALAYLDRRQEPEHGFPVRRPHRDRLSVRREAGYGSVLPLSASLERQHQASQSRHQFPPGAAAISLLIFRAGCRDDQASRRSSTMVALSRECLIPYLLS